MCNYKSETERTKVHYSFYDAIICTIKISKGAQIFHLLQLFDRERYVLFKQKFYMIQNFYVQIFFKLQYFRMKICIRIVKYSIIDNKIENIEKL